MKYLALLFTALFASSALAQTCDQTLTMTVAQGGQTRVTVSTVYTGLDKAEVKAMNDKRAAKVMNVASKQQDKGGTYTVTLDASGSCGTMPGGEHRGVTRQGLNAIARAGTETELAQDFKKRGARVWGD